MSRSGCGAALDSPTPMKIECPICSMSIEITKDHVGRKGRCTKCESKFIIPKDPDGDFEILPHRGEVPVEESESKPSLMVPSKGQPRRRSAPVALVQKSNGLPLGLFTAGAICSAVVIAWAISSNSDPGVPPEESPAPPENGRAQACENNPEQHPGRGDRQARSDS